MPITQIMAIAVPILIAVITGLFSLYRVLTVDKRAANRDDIAELWEENRNLRKELTELRKEIAVLQKEANDCEERATKLLIENSLLKQQLNIKE